MIIHNLTDEEINQKIAVSVQPFKGKVTFDEPNHNNRFLGGFI